MSDPKFAWNGKTYQDIRDHDAMTVLGPYAKIEALTANGTAFDTTRAVYASADCTATITDAYGNTLSGFPLVKGENRLCLTAIASVSGGASVWGAY